jgi:UDP-N-acetylglucosamine 1-carboxyvinyltransferase
MENNLRSIRVSRSKLLGEVRVSGAKNSVLRLLAATILSKNDLQINNFPGELLDVKVHIGMLEALGKIVSVEEEVAIIEENRELSKSLEWEGRSIRNTLLILGALVGRYGEGKVPLPGGCKLGDRKYDLHIMVLETLGAKVWEEKGFLCASTKGNRLVGTDIKLPIRSTGATENSILASVLAKGTTKIWNPHIRPEIIDLIDFLNKMGARIQVFGQQNIVIHGVEDLGSATHRVIPDNMEAITWAIGAAITGGEVEIHDFPLAHLEVPLAFLRESGMKYYVGPNSLIVKGCNPYPIEISTGPYPGINSDMQPLFAVYGACAKGTSKIIDLRFPGRYGYAKELAKMGLSYSVDGEMLVLKGGPLVGATVEALDLRAGMALTLAGMIADGETEIESFWQTTRGYNNILEKLSSLGACISKA